MDVVLRTAQRLALKDTAWPFKLAEKLGISKRRCSN